MQDHERHEGGDDFHAEVSDVEPAADVADAPPSPRSPLESRRTPRQRVAWRVATLLAALAAVVILASVGNLPNRFAALIAGPTPTATSRAAFSPDQFYLLPNPPGVDVTLDGHLVTRLPLPGDPHPLRLSHGPHVFAWHSQLFPFVPLRCSVSVPRAPSDTCAFVSRQSLPPSIADLPGAVIAAHATLTTLDPAVGGGSQLSDAIQRALDASRSTATVQPGEQYYSFQQNQAGTPVVATQPLRATLSYQFLTGAGYTEPCILTQPAIPCRFPGQDCSELCTVAQPPASVVDTPETWIAAAIVSAAWTYTTLDGHIVAQNVGEQFGIQLAALRITWDGAQWHVTPLFGHTPGLDVADDAACDPLRFALSNTSSWSFMLNDPPPGAQVYFASDATPADGCAAMLAQAPGGPAGAGVFLQRFGVLLTVNDIARNPVDNLPVADPAEQHLAQQLLTELPACGATASCPTAPSGQASVEWWGSRIPGSWSR